MQQGFDDRRVRQGARLSDGKAGPAHPRRAIDELALGRILQAMIVAAARCRQHRPRRLDRLPDIASRYRRPNPSRRFTSRRFTPAATRPAEVEAAIVRRRT